MLDRRCGMGGLETFQVQYSSDYFGGGGGGGGGVIISNLLNHG